MKLKISKKRMRAFKTSLEKQLLGVFNNRKIAKRKKDTQKVSVLNTRVRNLKDEIWSLKQKSHK